MMYASVVVLNVTTGADIYALAFLIPLGVSAYAIVGGLKARLLPVLCPTMLSECTRCPRLTSLWASS